MADPPPPPGDPFSFLRETPHDSGHRLSCFGGAAQGRGCTCMSRGFYKFVIKDCLRVRLRTNAHLHTSIALKRALAPVSRMPRRKCLTCSGWGSDRCRCVASQKKATQSISSTSTPTTTKKTKTRKTTISDVSMKKKRAASSASITSQSTHAKSKNTDAEITKKELELQLERVKLARLRAEAHAREDKEKIKLAKEKRRIHQWNTWEYPRMSHRSENSHKQSKAAKSAKNWHWNMCDDDFFLMRPSCQNAMMA